jgi:excisionase family DNA binding protein
MIRYKGKKYYTIKEVCKRLDVSKKTIYNWEKCGEIPPPQRDWRNWRLYTNDDIEKIAEFINSHRNRTNLLENEREKV